MSYATWTYYITTYQGTLITTQVSFNQLALRASAYLDRMTFNRAGSVTDTDDLDSLAMATCAVAEEIQSVNNEGSQGGIKSERVGQHSVEYSENNIKQLSLMQRYENVARLYLENTNGNLLYKGFIAGEYSGTVANEQ